MPTRRELLVGLGGLTILAGCQGDGANTPAGTTESRSDTTATPTTTATQTDTVTPTETATETQTETETETETDTPTETETETPTETTTTEDELTLEEIYRTHMIDAKPRGKQAVEDNWSHIQNQLDGNYSDEELPELVEDLAIQIDGELQSEPFASGFAHAIYNKLGYSTDKILVDARNIMTGSPQETVSVYTTPNPDAPNPETQVTTILPFGKYETEDNILKPHENNPMNREQTILNAWNDETWDILSYLNLSNILKVKNDTDYETNWQAIDRYNDDLILGYEMGGKGEVTFTKSAAHRIDEVLDVQNINENPAESGTEARSLIEDASVFFYNQIREGDGEYMAIDYEGGEFSYEVVDQERHEELETIFAD